MLKWLKAAGFKTPEKTWKCASADEFIEAINELDGLRHNFVYETDGAVVKLNSFALREKIGFTSKARVGPSPTNMRRNRPKQNSTPSPSRWAAPASSRPSRNSNPSFLAGSTISRATLHNEDELRRKDIRVGDTVTIEKAGEVIPAVVGVVLTKRTGKEKLFEFPKTCPECGTRVARTAAGGDDDEGVDWRWREFRLPRANPRRLEHWCARGAMDIEGGGEVLVSQLVKSGLAHDVADLYN